MKKIFGIITVLLLVISTQSCKQETAKMYNNKIVKQQVKITKKIDNLKKSIDDYNVLPASDAIKSMSNVYDSTVFQIDTSIAIIKKIGSFKKDSSLKIASLKLFTKYKAVVEQNYKEVIELYKLPDQMFTKADQKKLDSLMKSSADELNKAFVIFHDVQKKFADKFNLNLN